MRLLIVFVALLASSTALARPQFIALDVTDPQNNPADLGIRVSAKDAGSEIRFTVELDAMASKSIHSAFVFFGAPDRDRPEFRVTSTTKDGIKQFQFRIPERFVKPYTTNYFPNRPLTARCVLHLLARPIRPQDRIVNFNAYRLRLDNITVD